MHLRPTLLHKGNASRLCYVDCNRCLVTDVLPSALTLLLSLLLLLLHGITL